MKNIFPVLKQSLLNLSIFLCLSITFPSLLVAQNKNVEQQNLNSDNKQIGTEYNLADNFENREESNYPELDAYFDSEEYRSLPDSSVYIPEMISIRVSDDRITHLLNQDGSIINPFQKSKSLNKYRDGGNQIDRINNIVPDNIDFVEIDGKVYYRLFVTVQNLSKYFSERELDLNNYPGFLLLEIKEDINRIAEEFARNGADSVVVKNDNIIRIYKPQSALDANHPIESQYLIQENYPGYFTYARLEPSVYLPLKNNYPQNAQEVKYRRTTSSRHYWGANGEINAYFTVRPTSYPILPDNIDLELLSDAQREKIKWVELPACYPIPHHNQTKATYTLYFDETFYGHSVYCTNDETYPYVWICAPADGNYLGTIGAMRDDDFWSGDEHNYNRIHDKFDITSIPDGSDITAAAYETFLPNIAPFTTGDCDGLINWEEVRPEVKDMYSNMTAANNIHTDGQVDYYTNTWYNDVEDGTQFYIPPIDVWPWDRGNGYTNYDVVFNAAGLTDVESRLAGNWYVVGIADGDENNQSPIFWQAVATYNYYSNFRVSYIPCCQAPDYVVAYANGAPSNSVCPNGNVNLTVNDYAGGGCACGTWRYAWSNGSQWWNGSSFGSSSPVYNSGYSSISTTVSSNTTFTLRMECSACGSYVSDNVSVSVYSNSSAATSISGNSSICPGESTTLTLNGGSLGTGASWVWYSGSCGGTVVGTGNSISVSPSSNTTYYVRAEGNCNTTSCVSRTVTLQTNSSPATSATASPSNINSGGNSTLSLSGGSLGSGAQWVWYEGSCGGTQVGTGTSVSVNPTVTTTYYVRAEGNCNNTSCISVTVFVSGSVTMCAGDELQLSLNGGSLGTGASWHWYSGSCGGTAVGTGAVISQFPTSSITYYVRAEGNCNITGCASINVIVNSLSVAATSVSGTNSIICEGGSSTLTLNGGSLGTGASWQWYSGSCGGAFVGTGNSVTVSPSTTTTYYVRAEGICNFTACRSYTVTVVPDLSISINTSSTTVCYGGSVAFTQSTGGGTGTITNQWQTSTDGSTWTNWTTSTNPIYNNMTESMFFRCIRSATGTGCGDAISNIVFVEVVPDPVISTQPISPDPICVGGTTDPFTVIASGGTGNFSYQWQYHNGGSWGNVSNGTPAGASYTGATSNTLTVAGISNPGIYDYQCVIFQVGNGCDPIISNTVNVEVVPDPTVTIVGATSVCSGGSATLLASESGGTGSLSYQWQSSPDGSSWTNISGATNATYITPSLTSTTYYRVIISMTGSGCGSATSNTQAISIVPDPSVTTHPTGTTICSGGTHTMNVSGTGGAPFVTYQWQSSPDGSTWADIVGAESDSYTTPALTSTTYYRVYIDAGGSGCDGVLTNVAIVTVVDDPSISISSSQTICYGATASLTSSTSGGTGTCSFQWQSSLDGSSWSNISGATSANYTTPTITSTTYYRCIRTCTGTGCDAATSNTVTIDIEVVDPVISTCPVTRNIEGCDTGDVSSPGFSSSETASSYAVFSSAPNNGVASDNCGIASVTYQDSYSGTCPIQINRTWTITDEAGNSASCVQIININDNTSPNVAGSIPVTTVEGCDASDAPAAVTSVSALEALGLSISDACSSDANLSISHVDIVSGSCPVIIRREYTIEDECGNTSSYIQTINVDDTTIPSITGTIPVSTVYGCDVSDAPAVAGSVSALEALGLNISDACTTDGNLIVSNSDSFSGSCPIVLNRTYSVEDECNNFNTYIQTINIQVPDFTPPTDDGSTVNCP
ncbi:MAG: hypothetical protein PHE33_09805, partial [Bacteroidales bacterium]|nr:hypothetical protein [Bacteroidales bacterium]